MDHFSKSRLYCSLFNSGIISSPQVVQNPCVIGNFQNKRVVISIDKSLVLFDNETFSNCKFLNFESVIDCLIVSSQGSIVICGLSDGSICGVHIHGVVIFNLYVSKNYVSVQSLRCI